MRDALSLRVQLQAEIVDLTSLVSVEAFAQRLLHSAPKLDAVILNAGVAGVYDNNWPLAFWTIAIGPVQALTWPIFKLASIGSLTPRQLPGKATDEPPLGNVFCANVFGHYVLVHRLASRLSSDSVSQPSGRIIWVGSIEPHDGHFNLADLQGLTSDKAYESSKRLTEILALTSDLPGTKPWVKQFLSTDSDSFSASASASPPKVYLTHPGVCATGIVPLNKVLFCLFYCALYLARWLGSPWHTIKTYSAACSAVWVALSPAGQLDTLNPPGAGSKWGSATDTMGRERVARTHVEGWGYRGVVGEEGTGANARRGGRRAGTVDLTPEAREDFEVLGREAWKAMEALRVQWEDLLQTHQ
ncbi:MAG: 3-keto-steroid reductase [Thelocarpon superellum]|nr:MAG: 3-keto-steroid reductase [Thelocarpon superellum]